MFAPAQRASAAERQQSVCLSVGLSVWSHQLLIPDELRQLWATAHLADLTEEHTAVH